MSDRKDLAKTILSVARFFGKELSQDSLSMVLDVWEMQIAQGAVTFPEIIDAYNQSILAFRTYPAPVQILELISPQLSPEDESALLAGKVIDAVKRYGYMGGGSAKAVLGDVAWTCVNRFGGWAYLCENLGTGALPIGTFQAQLKQSLSATSKEFKRSDRAINSNQLTSGGEILKLLGLTKE